MADKPKAKGKPKPAVRGGKGAQRARKKQVQFLQPRVRLEPPRFGLLGGVAGGTAALAWFLVRQYQGVSYDPPRVILGAAISFVLSYGAAGLLTWYIVKIRDRELGPPPEVAAAAPRAHLGKGEAGAAAAEPAPESTTAEDTA